MDERIRFKIVFLIISLIINFNLFGINFCFENYINISQEKKIFQLDENSRVKIKKKYPVKFIYSPSELDALNCPYSFSLVEYKNDEKTINLLINGKLKYIKAIPITLTERIIGMVIEKKGKLIFLNREEAIKLCTPIRTKEEALALLCLVESAKPIYDLSSLGDQVIDIERMHAGRFSYKKEGLKPTHIIEEEDYYLINLFGGIYYHSYDEILYKIDKEGNIEIINKEPAFK